MSGWSNNRRDENTNWGKPSPTWENNNDNTNNWGSDRDVNSGFDNQNSTPSNEEQDNDGAPSFSLRNQGRNSNQDRTMNAKLKKLIGENPLGE